MNALREQADNTPRIFRSQPVLSSRAKLTFGGSLKGKFARQYQVDIGKDLGRCEGTHFCAVCAPATCVTRQLCLCLCLCLSFVSPPLFLSPLAAGAAQPLVPGCGLVKLIFAWERSQSLTLMPPLQNGAQAS